MEHSFYLKESPGVGTYMKDQETVIQSMLRNSSHFKFPKNDRKLQQGSGEKVTPGPHEYDNDTIKTKLTEPRMKVGQASRDVPFSKYGALHSELVRKGLH